ncbi:MAG: hypothetical protein V1838_05800 [Patescibacteria group bacterium]
MKKDFHECFKNYTSIDQWYKDFLTAKQAEKSGLLHMLTHPGEKSALEFTEIFGHYDRFSNHEIIWLGVSKKRKILGGGREKDEELLNNTIWLIINLGYYAEYLASQIDVQHPSSFEESNAVNLIGMMSYVIVAGKGEMFNAILVAMELGLYPDLVKRAFKHLLNDLFIRGDKSLEHLGGFTKRSYYLLLKKCQYNEDNKEELRQEMIRLLVKCEEYPFIRLNMLDEAMPYLLDECQNRFGDLTKVISYSKTKGRLRYAAKEVVKETWKKDGNDYVTRKKKSDYHLLETVYILLGLKNETLDLDTI